jgi:hypothetical protein
MYCLLSPLIVVFFCVTLSIIISLESSLAFSYQSISVYKYYDENACETNKLHLLDYNVKRKIEKSNEQDMQ